MVLLFLGYLLVWIKMSMLAYFGRWRIGGETVGLGNIMMLVEFAIINVKGPLVWVSHRVSPSSCANAEVPFYPYLSVHKCKDALWWPAVILFCGIQYRNSSTLCVEKLIRQCPSWSWIKRFWNEWIPSMNCCRTLKENICCLSLLLCYFIMGLYAWLFRKQPLCLSVNVFP